MMESIKVKLRTWYPCWLVRWKTRRAIKKHNKKQWWYGNIYFQRAQEAHDAIVALHKHACKLADEIKKINKGEGD